jgi:hypothetical protein
VSLPAQPIQAGVESLGVASPEIGDSSYAERPEVGCQAGADRGQVLKLVGSGVMCHCDVASDSGSAAPLRYAEFRPNGNRAHQRRHRL